MMETGFSENFWEIIENLEYLNSDEVIQLIEENKHRAVSFPENMLLKQILERDKAAGVVKLSQISDLEKKHLLKDRVEKGDFFISESPDLPFFRDDIASMENPLFALKAGDTRVIEYVSNSKGQQLQTTIRPAVGIGRATIFDKDIWIFAISKLMQAKFDGQEINNAVEVSVSEFLKVTNRGDGGNQFVMFKEALDRLQGTTIKTEIETGGVSSASGFGLLDGWEVVQENNKKIPLKVVIQLPGWLYRSIQSNEVLSISNQYFRLKKPIDRRIYEIARKHCGNQNSWKVSLEKLHEKTGASMTLRKFRMATNSLSEAKALPDFQLEYDRASDMVTFINQDDAVKADMAQQKVLEVLKKSQLS